MDLYRGNHLPLDLLEKILTLLSTQGHILRSPDENSPGRLSFLDAHRSFLQSKVVIWAVDQDQFGQIQAVAYGICYEKHLHILHAYLRPEIRGRSTQLLFQQTFDQLHRVGIESYSYFRYTTFAHPSASSIRRQMVRRWILRSRGMIPLPWRANVDQHGILIYGDFCFIRHCIFDGDQVREVHVLLSASLPLAFLHACPTEWIIVGNSTFEGYDFGEVYVDGDCYLYSTRELNFAIC